MEDQIKAITSKLYITKEVDNIFSTNFLLSKLRAGERSYDGGTSIAIPIEYAQGASGGSFNGLELLNTSFGDIITQAEYDWRQYYSPLGWSRKDYLMNKGSKQKIVDMVASITRNAGKTMQKNLTTGIFQTTKAASTDIDGLVTAVVAASTTDCGGLDSNDFSTWAANRDTTTTRLSLASLNNLWRDCSDGPDQPTIMVTTDDILGFFYDISTPLQRYQNDAALKAGFEGVMTFNGVPFYADKNAPANYVFMMNLDHLWLAVHQDENMRYQEPQVPLDQAGNVGHIFWMGNLVTDARRRQGVMTAVTS